MKKLMLISSLMLMLGGCSNSRFSKVENTLYNMGYSAKEVECILSLDLKEQEYFLESYHKNLAGLLRDGRYKPEYYSLFKAYENKILNDDMYVLKDYLKQYGDFIVSLYRDRFFMMQNLELYIEYKDEFESTRDLVEYVNVGAYKTWFEDAEYSDIDNPKFVIASKLYSIEEYVPDDIVTLDPKYCVNKGVELNAEAANAFEELYEAAAKQDISLKISTAYRSYSFQKLLYTNYLKNDPQEVVDTYSSRPGYSDHQTGFACDVRANGLVFEEMNGSVEGEWLKDNSYKYGFVVRYPEGKDKITGYMWEAWHLRYVGKEAAIVIHDNNITFDEYYEYYIKNK